MSDAPAGGRPTDRDSTISRPPLTEPTPLLPTQSPLLSGDGAEGEPRRALSLRAFVIGSLLAVLVNLLVPYNDYVVANTFLVGSFLPLALVLTILLLVIIGNGIYRRLLPRQAFRTGELAVILMMLLVACSVPSQGFFRAMLPGITAPFYFGQTNPAFWRDFLAADMPGWLYPVPSIRDGPGSEVITYFYGKVPEGGTIPYRAWLVPLAAWGVYFVGLALTLVSLAYLFRIQWTQNERLPFPLAQLQLSLIEAPRPGRSMNELFRTSSFWIATALILILHSLNALHLYDERWPEITRSYDLKKVLSEEPWRYLPDTLRASPIYFTFIGIAYFIRTRVAFSMWAIYLMMQVFTAARAAAANPVPAGQANDWHLGASLAFAAGMLWIARQFLWSTLSAALGARNGADRGAAWAMRFTLLGIAILFGWFMAVGAAWGMAVLTIVIVLMSHLVTSRVVAETGMSYVRINAGLVQIITAMPAADVSARTTYLAGFFTMNGGFHARESVLGLSQHGMVLVDQAGGERKPKFWALGIVIAWTLAISFVAASWSSLTCYYSYAMPISKHTPFGMLNEDIASGHAKAQLETPMVQHQSGTFAPRGYDVTTHVGIGFAIVAVLQVATWSLTWWPFLPVGYLMAGSTFIGSTWFSIFLGWLAKLTVFKIGGPRLLDRARPIFIGLIFGESLAAAVWTAIGLVLAINGYDYYPYAALPK